MSGFHRTRDIALRMLAKAKVSATPLLPAPLFDAVAKLTLSVLRDRKHALSQQLRELQRRIALKREDDRGVRWQDHNLFLPQPGISDSHRRQYWFLQLLLHVTARSSSRNKLQQKLGMPARSLTKALMTSMESHHLGGWSQLYLAERLHEAIDGLDPPASDLPWRIEKNVLHHPTQGDIKLTPQDARMLSLLIQKEGQACAFAAFTGAGISHPRKAKSRLLSTLMKHGVEDREIVAGQLSYSLIRRG